jgi:hypothetical protein
MLGKSSQHLFHFWKYCEGESCKAYVTFNISDLFVQQKSFKVSKPNEDM